MNGNEIEEVSDSSKQRNSKNDDNYIEKTAYFNGHQNKTHKITIASLCNRNDKILDDENASNISSSMPNNVKDDENTNILNSESRPPISIKLEKIRKNNKTESISNKVSKKVIFLEKIQL